MKVAIYYPWVYLTSGVEKVIAETIKRSKNDYTIFTNHFDKKGTYREFEKFNVVELERVPVKRDIFSVLKAAITIAGQKIDLEGFDCLLVHSDGLGDLILTRNGDIPTVCFCHTPLRPIFDEHYREKALEKRDILGKLAFYTSSYLFKKVDQRLWRKYDHIVFNSNETKRRAKKGGLLEGRKRQVEILHPGVDYEKNKPKWVYKPFFLLPGRIMWAKNIELAISAFLKAKEEGNLSDFRLVIAGKVDEKSKTYLASLREMARGSKDIEFVVSPKEKQLKKLYSECWAVLLTSFNEDWGVTALEGNLYGKAVIAVDRGGPKESQIDGKTGYLVAENKKAVSDKMVRLANGRELTKKLGKEGRENVKNYDWSQFVQRLDEVLDKVSSKDS